MATNPYFSQKVRSEQNLYEEIVIESLRMYGQDVYYLPRDVVNEDRVFGDDVPSRFNSSYKVEMYMENIEGFDGEGDLFTKFGVEIRDQATFVVARRRWTTTVKQLDNDITEDRPREGDLIYLPLSNSMFQIMQVEHEQPFYQLSNLPVYKLRCEMFEYNDEDMDTGIGEIDGIERDYAYGYQLVFNQSRAAANVTVTERTISSLNLLNAGSGYPTSPSIFFSNLPATSQKVKFGSNSLQPNNTDPYTLQKVIGDWNVSGNENSRGNLSFWVYVNDYDDVYYTHLITLGNDNIDGLNYRSSIAIANTGQIGIIQHDPIFGTNFNILGTDVTSVVPTDQWVHLELSIRGEVSGSTERMLQFYINGSVTFRNSDPGYRGLLDDGYQIGGTITAGGHEQVLLDGFIDDVFATNENPAVTDTVSIPGARTGTEAGIVGLEAFNTPTPIATPTLVNGAITTLTLSNNHNYFRLAPNISINEPREIIFTPQEIVSQTIADGVTMYGEVSSYSADNKLLELIHVGANDGKYHTFTTTSNIVGASSSLIPTSVTEVNQISENEQNDDFESLGASFLDFSETNPFGDPND